MRKIVSIFFCLFSLTAFGQKQANAFDGKNWQPPYVLAAPKGWDIERFLIPIGFAQQIAYHGFEDIRFTPGWGNVKSSEYWSYAYLWMLDGYPKMNKKIITANLTAYYNGLVKRNVEPKKIAADKIIPTKVAVKKIKATNKDWRTYLASIEMLDYMQQKQLMLHCMIHIKKEKEKNKTFVFYELSPKPLQDSVWLSLHQLWASFDSGK